MKKLSITAATLIFFSMMIVGFIYAFPAGISAIEKRQGYFMALEAIATTTTDQGQ